MSYAGAPRRSEKQIKPGVSATRHPGAIRAALSIVFGLALAGLIQGPAGAQEIPTPTPPPTAEPSPLPTSEPSQSTAPAHQERSERVRPAKSDGRKGGRQHKKPRGSFRRQQRKNQLRATCAPFTFNQTYPGWGPALTYGRVVTVAYEASRCSKPHGTALDLSVDGTATVYDGTTAEGTPLDARGFTVSGTWDQPSNAIGWPPNWWECGVKSARYSWQIPGVYSFNVSARWGVWTLSVETQGPVPTSIHWSFNGCG